MRIRVRAVLAASAAVLLAVALTPGRASAATYDGQMAAAAGCGSDAETKRERVVTNGEQLGTVVGRVQLRYSLRCRTVWTRITTQVIPSTSSFTGLVERNSDLAQLGCTERGWSDLLNAYYCLTPMLNDRNVTSRAYGILNYQGVPYGGYTGSY
jgi:hypothetical protein